MLFNLAMLVTHLNVSHTPHCDLWFTQSGNGNGTRTRGAERPEVLVTNKYQDNCVAGPNPELHSDINSDNLQGPLQQCGPDTSSYLGLRNCSFLTWDVERTDVTDNLHVPLPNILTSAESWPWTSGGVKSCLWLQFTQTVNCFRCFLWCTAGVVFCCDL